MSIVRNDPMHWLLAIFVERCAQAGATKQKS
jgi:hypothetical protein